MTSTRPSLACALFCVTTLYLMVKMTLTVSVARPSSFVRQRRSLTFPYGFDESYLEFIFGIGLPMDLPHPYQVLMSIEIRADYRYPVNASDFTNPTKRREEKEKEKEKKTEMAGGESTAVQLRGTDVTQTKSNGTARTADDLGVGDSNTGNKFNFTGYQDNVGNDKSKVKAVETQVVTSKTITDTVDDVTKKGSNGNMIGTSETTSDELVNKQLTYLDKSNISDINYTVGNINTTEQLDSVDFEDEDTHNNTKDAAWEDVGDEGDLDDSEEEEESARFISKRDTGSRSTRWRIYYVLELAGNNLGMDGRACLLRSICDSAATPLNHRSNGLVGELVHVLLTPSTTDDERGRYLVDEYHSAERLGAEVGNKCRLLFPECDVSFLDLITKFDL